MKNIKLNSLTAEIVSRNEMNNISGGGECGCGCHYANSGGSSSGVNMVYNGASGGLHSTGGSDLFIADDVTYRWENGTLYYEASYMRGENGAFPR